MIRTAILAAIALVCATSVQARPKAAFAHPDCNIVFPCEGVVASPRGERVVKAMGGFGAARKLYLPRSAAAPRREVKRTIVDHPTGCPRRAFCGCGAAVRVFGSPIRKLWLAASWFAFPRAAPAAGMVAVRRHHVFVLESHLGGSTWLAYDANSGGHRTRVHARSIAGYVIVNPHAVRSIVVRR
ncbi:hypothetical protein [Bradyrhizobium liaoningense]|uniref:hypothetical protein n=1 Tax=Bradyrhizobium liaoningense TaxID=43992 RepID=UPI0004B3DCF8|nr:hypothetical protein [Bradyrhizobium liaoningense]